jgi:tetratricopeptide (TPR) repeat protein
LYNLAMTYEQMRRYKDALETLNESMESARASGVEPDGWTYLEAGRSLLALGQPEQACPLFEKSIKQFIDREDPVEVQANLASAYYSWAKAYKKMGRTDQARQLVHKVLAFTPQGIGIEDVRRAQGEARALLAQLDEK